ncbi:MAG: hypothetical protein LAO08_13905 [Acidobacteriia bacterium]|nr:hypothetical protein [Terriglobia bacterium]
MKRQTQLIVLGVLFAVLLVVAYYAYPRNDSAPNAVPAAAFNDRFTPLNVDNPALRMDILKRFLALEYKGVHRNIFSASAPPPPQPVVQKPPEVIAPPVPTGPPPLTVDAKYFGYVSDMNGSQRKAFFATANNEDVIIAGEGDMFLGRFRVDRLTSTSADVEEVSSGRHTTMALEQPGPNG